VSGAISQTAVTAQPALIGDDGGTILECAGIEGTVWNGLFLGIEHLHGPGAYATPAPPSVSHSYQFRGCGLNGTCTPENFGDEPDSVGCTVVLTEAPTGYVYGARVQGTFSCPELVADSDASRRVAISGSFSAELMPPPQ